MKFARLILNKNNKKSYFRYLKRLGLFISLEFSLRLSINFIVIILFKS